MAQLAVSVAGAAAGYAIGGPAGARFGWLAGSIIGSMLFPTKLPGQSGPRLGDLTVTASTYGQAIPKLYGTGRVAGNIIWATRIQEVSTTTSQSAGGKGGGTSQSTTTYSYFSSFAVSFAEGVKQDVLRIWADGKLIYDVTSAAAFVRMQGLKFRFYKGDEDQLPDSLIEADKGVGNVPAYRGLAYIVFDRLPLANFGNRIPNITVELSTTPEISYAFTPFTYNFAATFGSGHSGGYDSKRKILFGNPTLSPSNGALNTFRVPSMVESQQTPSDAYINYEAAITAATEGFVSDTYNWSLLAVDRYTGSIFRHMPFYNPSVIGSKDYHIFKVSPLSLIATQAFPPDFDGTRHSYFNSTVQYAVSSFAATTSVISDLGGSSFLCTAADSTYLATVNLGILDINTMTNVWFNNAIPGTAMLPIAGEQRVGSSDMFFPAIQSGNASVQFYKAQIGDGGISFGLAFTLLAATFGGSTFTAANVDGFVYDIDTNALIGCIKCSGINYVISVSALDGTLNWKTVPSVNGVTAISVTFALERYVDMSKTPLYIAYNGDNVMRFDKYKGTQIDTILSISFIDGANHDAAIAAFDPDLNAVVFNVRGVAAGQPATGIFYLDKLTNGTVTLESIVQDLSACAGLSTSELVTSDLAAISVKGYVVSQQCSVREALTPLSTAYFFDGVESDGAIKFLTRGRSVSASLVQSDLGATASGTSDFWAQSRAQEQDMPMRVNVAYVDINLDYQQGTQYGKRASTPTPVMWSKNETSVALPIVLTGAEAKQIANKLLYTAWMQRDTYAATLPWTFLALDPADVIDVTLDDGTVYKVNLSSVDVGANLTIAIHATGEDSTTYVSAAAAENHFIPALIQSGDNTTVLQVYNVPLLTDLHDQLRTKSVVYYQAAPLFAGSNWEGCTVYSSYDSINWTYVSRLVAPMLYGHVGNTLGAPALVNSVDTVNTLTVWPVANGADLVSITLSELLAGSHNMVIVGNEIINFQTVSGNGDGSYTLSGLLRGRRGTDVQAGLHVANENFYLVDVNTMATILLPLTKIGVPVYLKAVGNGQTLEEVPAITFTPTGEDLKPYAPVNATRTADLPSAGDITLRWNRRTRINGDLYAGGAVVPLNEDTESYSVDILSGHAGSVLRTLTSVTESVVYTSANVVTDFGGPPATLYCRIYQISGEVGRGQSYEFAIGA